MNSNLDSLLNEKLYPEFGFRYETESPDTYLVRNVFHANKELRLWFLTFGIMKIKKDKK